MAKTPNQIVLDICADAESLANAAVHGVLQIELSDELDTVYAPKERKFAGARNQKEIDEDEIHQAAGHTDSIERLIKRCRFLLEPQRDWTPAQERAAWMLCVAIGCPTTKLKPRQKQGERSKIAERGWFHKVNGHKLSLADYNLNHPIGGPYEAVGYFRNFSGRLKTVLMTAIADARKAFAPELALEIEGEGAKKGAKKGAA